MKQRRLLKERVPKRMHWKTAVDKIQANIKKFVDDEKSICVAGRQIGRSAANDAILKWHVRLHKELRRLIGRKAYQKQFPKTSVPVIETSIFAIPKGGYKQGEMSVFGAFAGVNEVRLSNVVSKMVSYQRMFSNSYHVIHQKQHPIIATDCPIFIRFDLEREYELPDWLPPKEKDTTCPLLIKNH